MFKLERLGLTSVCRLYVLGVLPLCALFDTSLIPRAIFSWKIFHVLLECCQTGAIAFLPKRYIMQ